MKSQRRLVLAASVYRARDTRLERSVAMGK